MPRFMHFKRKPQQAGVTLIEVMVATGLLVLGGVALSQYMSGVKRNRQYIRLRAVQEAIAHDLESKLASPANLYLSTQGTPPVMPPRADGLTANGDFLACLLGGENRGPDLPACRAEVTAPDRDPTRLQYDRFEELPPFALAAPSGTGPIVFVSPRFYNIRGRPLATNDPANPAVFFQTDTRFYAVCPIPESGGKRPDACTSASSFRFTFRVSVVPDRTLNGRPVSNNRLPPLPRPRRPGTQLLSFTTMSADQILGNQTNNSCHHGSIIRGYRRDGRAICECVLPYVPRELPPLRDIFQRPFCAPMPASAVECPAGTIFRGLASDEPGRNMGRVDCVSVTDAYDCTYFVGGVCGEGYALNQIVQPRCEVRCQVGKGGGECLSNETTATRSGANHGLFCNPLSPPFGIGGTYHQSLRAFCCRPKKLY